MKGALNKGTGQISVAVRSLLVRAEDLLVAVHAAPALADHIERNTHLVDLLRAILFVLRRVEEYVALANARAIDLEVNESAVVVVSIGPAATHEGGAIRAEESVLPDPVSLLALPGLEVEKVHLARFTCRLNDLWQGVTMTDRIRHESLDVRQK